MDRVFPAACRPALGHEIVVNADFPDYLRLHTEDESGEAFGLPEPPPYPTDLADAFRAATGWSLSVEPPTEQDPWVGPAEPSFGSAGAPEVRLTSVPSAANLEQGPDWPPVELCHAQELADAVGQLIGDLHQARNEIRRREADLAAGVPVSNRAREEEHLADRLESVLKGGAQAVGAHAAAIYLLDDATTELKMRASWGLPKERLLDAPRPLRGSVADLEALVGHAVVLEDTQLLPHWKVPEPFASAVCVPISSTTDPLGTLWVFCEEPRDFSPKQTNLIEIIAGRVTAELQRAILLRECVQNKGIDRELRRAAEWQNNRLPCVAPLLDDWDLAGWCCDNEVLNHAFYDWFVPADGSLALAVGETDGALLEAALTAAALHGTVRSHSDYRHDAAQMLGRVNETFWSSSAGGQFASLFYALIHPETGELTCACAGTIEVLILRASGPEVLPLQFPPLGSQPNDVYPARTFPIEHGETLVVLGNLGKTTRTTDQRREYRQAIVGATQDYHDRSPRELIDHLNRWHAANEEDLPATHGCMLAVRRK